MNKLLLLSAAILTIGAGCVRQTETSSPESPTKQIFRDRETCERETGKLCSYTMCDYAPPGKTIEEVCGPGPNKGWVPKN